MRRLMGFGIGCLFLFLGGMILSRTIPSLLEAGDGGNWPPLRDDLWAGPIVGLVFAFLGLVSVCGTTFGRQ